MSQRDVPDYFAFYPYEFMSDERVLAMTLEQLGAYLLLIISQWINGSIPSDIPTLARLLKRTTAEMEILWEGVGPCFGAHPELPGRLVQKRVEEERAKAITAILSERERKRAYRDAKKRKSADGDGDKRGQIGDSTGPSTLLYSSYIHKTTSLEECNTKWVEFKRLYPPHRLDEERAAAAFVSREEEADAILAGLRLWVKADQWKENGGKFVNAASRFISEGVYKIQPQALAAEVKAPKPFDIRKITG